MFFRQLLNDETACASYLFGCKTHGAVRGRRSARRPRRRLHRARRGAGRRRSSPCFETHVQADHVSGPARARRAHRRDRLPARGRRRRVRAPRARRRRGRRARQHRDRGDRDARATRSPITPTSSPTTRRGDEPWFVLTGDALLVGDAGRPDLHAHGEHTVEEMARTLYRSLTERLLDAARPPAALPGALLGLGLRPRAVGQPGLDDRLRAPPQPRAAVRLRGRVRRRR